MINGIFYWEIEFIFLIILTNINNIFYINKEKIKKFLTKINQSPKLY